MTKYDDEKIKKEKKRRGKFKKRVTELISFYVNKGLSADDVCLYRPLIEHLAHIDVMIQEYQEDMMINGYEVKYMNGRNQWGYKRSEATDLFKKWYADRLSDSERLNKLLFGDDSKDLDDGFDEFASR